jgi:hypothetical protein
MVDEMMKKLQLKAQNSELPAINVTVVMTSAIYNEA